MSVELLDKIRKFNRLLHSNTANKFMFNDICAVLSDVLMSNTLVISKKGKVLGIHTREDIEVISMLLPDSIGMFIDNNLNERFLNVLSTMENISLMTFGLSEHGNEEYEAIIVPINIAGERLGTLFVYRKYDRYDIDDIIVSEYGTTVVGLEMLRSVKEEDAEVSRKRQTIKAAMGTLSYSEIEAIGHVFNELPDKEGLLVASKIAERVGITRSVIVNALRKLESAGVIESHSSGMKGTYIKVLNDDIFAELKK